MNAEAGIGGVFPTCRECVRVNRLHGTGKSVVDLLQWLAE